MLEKVNAAEFWKRINDEKLDVIISISNKFPYKHTFKFRYGRVYGVIQDNEFGCSAEYYLNK